MERVETPTKARPTRTIRPKAASASPTSEASDGAIDLQDVLAPGGHIPQPALTEFVALATGAQRARRRAGLSDREGITRSTALWALMKTDGKVTKALEQAGMRTPALAAQLGLPRSVEPVPMARSLLDSRLAEALKKYLRGFPPRSRVEPADVAAAVLHSAIESPSDGLLPRRLAELKLDYSKALSLLEAGRVTQGEPTSEYSASVRAAVQRLGPSRSVTAGEVAAAIQSVHPQYVGGRFGRIPLRQQSGQRLPVEEWLQRVGRLYDLDEVRHSRRGVIDGELLVLALAEIEPALAEDLSAERLLETWRASVDVLPRRLTSDQTRWMGDDPATTDFLGRRFLAQALANRLRSVTGAAASFLVHIDGPWGSGKSTLFEFLESELKRDHLLVRVNAWREQQVGVQWWTLHQALRLAVERDADHRWRAKVRSRFDVVRTKWVPFLAAIAVPVVVVPLLFLINDFSITRSSQIADAIAKIVALVVLAGAGVTAAYRFLLPDTGRAAQNFAESSANPMAEVRRLFARTLKRSRKPVVFLIDDLDRCNEEYTVAFLNAVQTLVRDAPDELRRLNAPRRVGPYAFIAADGQWIRSSYESHFSSVRVSEIPGRPLGYLFLEKVFQLHVRLPSITNEAKVAFYEALLKPSGDDIEPSGDQRRLADEINDAVSHATTGDDISKAAQGASQITSASTKMEVLGRAAVRFSEVPIQADVHHELVPFGQFLEPNPRSIKLFVNTYGTLQTLRTLEGIRIVTAPLALWTIIEIRWPQLADHLRLHPDDVDVNPSTPESIKQLLQSQEVNSVVRESRWGPLTPDQIRACTGTAV